MTDVLISQLRDAVTHYHMPARARDVIMASRMTMICGVTAAGKNTVVRHLIDHSDYEYVVSHTTRAARENHGVQEQNGVAYWFVTNEQMLEMVQSQAFVEVKAIHGDTFYGTSISSIEHAVRDNKRPISEIDVQGAQEFIKAIPSFRPIFILPPNYEIWMERLGTRGYMSEGEKERRLDSARTELRAAIDNTAFVMVVNHEMELTTSEIIKGVDSSQSVQAEHRELAQELLDYIK